MWTVRRVSDWPSRAKIYAGKREKERLARIPTVLHGILSQSLPDAAGGRGGLQNKLRRMSAQIEEEGARQQTGYSCALLTGSFLWNKPTSARAMRHAVAMAYARGLPSDSPMEKCIRKELVEFIEGT